MIKKEELSGSSFLITGNGSLAVQNTSVVVRDASLPYSRVIESGDFLKCREIAVFIGQPEIRIGFEFGKQPFRCPEISNYADRSYPKLLFMEELTILLVEDEQKIANTLKKGLTENGYRVDVAFDGLIGQRLFLANQYDLIILDINLPGINGYGLCRIIRNKNQQVPVIMLTALSTMNDKLEGFDAGSDDYLIKPFEFKELLVRIRALLKRTQHQQLPTGNILRINDLEMNLDTKEVKRNNHVISLTAKEFQLLEYMMRNKNRVVSRADIAVNVWDIDFDTKTNVIDVYVNYLRNKIDKQFPDKLIHTQIGMGYVLKEY